jgi:MFS family permease
MGQINIGRVILGGLVAGIVINVFELILNLYVLADQARQAMQRLNLSAEFSVNQILGFNVLGFATGILIVGLYAAIRPRYGAGPKTAMGAGFMVWLIGYLVPNAGFALMGLFPVSLIVIALCVGVAETVLAGLAGAYLYKEENEPASRTSAARA